MLLPGSDHGRQTKVGGLLGQRFLDKIQNSLSSDLSVSGEEGRSAILLTHYTFW